MEFFIFLAVCWSCSWCFDHGHIYMAFVIGISFGIFYLINRMIDSVEDEDCE